MGRYSLIFALLIASSFAVHPPQAVDKTAPTDSTKAPAAASLAKSTAVDPSTFLTAFLDKAFSVPDQAQNAAKKYPSIRVLFATVPHPLETHLATEFDSDVSALIDGLQDSGYLFDSAWIPWNHHGPRDQFDDDEKEKKKKKAEDDNPGILLFRENDMANNSYANGIVVFLISEKPTEGISLTQVQTAVNILTKKGIGLSDPLRILGPTFSGSFASLIPVVNYLSTPNIKPANAKIWIRSGSATGGADALTAMNAIATKEVDFGGAQHENDDWTQIAAKALCRMGIEPGSIATLNEGESAYGRESGITEAGSAGTPSKPQCSGAGEKGNRIETTDMWHLSFPRDISSLRADYEKQGILDTAAPAQPLNRFLNLKSDEQNDGDSVRTFGGVSTVEAQESILLGISEFLQSHDIRAVIISASNEEDRLFLTQFLHAHNSSVRVVVVGVTRVFMRGSTAQFRGDLMVDSFPMLPKLHDWTAGKDDHSARVFADSEAQGTYFAAIDLFARPQESDGDKSYKWFPEYSEPVWAGTDPLVQRPPMYVVALGSNATWPVAEWSGKQFSSDAKDPFVKMPFTLFHHHPSAASSAKPSKDSALILAGGSWKDIFFAMCCFTVVFWFCFWYAKPVSRSLFASFEPSLAWRFWLFKVTIPAAVAGCAFKVLAWAIDLPVTASSDAVCWHGRADIMTVLAPLGIAAGAVIKAFFWVKPVRAIEGQDSSSADKLKRAKLYWETWMAISFVPALAALVLYIKNFALHSPDVSGILSTYREMHWESGLSLLPTGMLFLFALQIWAAQAGNGAALIEEMPQLPEIAGKPRISQGRANIIQKIGRPLPPFTLETRWLWAVWMSLALAMLVGHFRFHPFTDITTLESSSITYLVRFVAGVIAALILLDLLQFVWLWNELRGLLRSLDREKFKRSFVPIDDFNWRKLWSITGTSLLDRRAILRKQLNCVSDLRGESGMTTVADKLEKLQEKYNKTDFPGIDSTTYRREFKDVFALMADAGALAATLIENSKEPEVQPEIDPSRAMLQIAIANQGAQKGGRFSDEKDEIARLPKRQQAAEELLCLLYIGYIQNVVARLHTLLISVGLMFSLLALGVAIYPFVPITPFLVAGFALLLLIGWAFFWIFSEMDRDPILSRIVNGDDRKLQGNFYVRFAEAVALPLLTLGSSLLPGGVARLLDLVQALLTHSQ